jgi:hypothetical protein
MQARDWLKKIQFFFEAFQLKNAASRGYIILTIFLLAIILISFIIPVLNFGRFFGTDDYTHLFHTKVMISSNGMADFYDKMGVFVSNPGSGVNEYNYPFGLWVFGATVAKITGMPLINAELLFVIFFLFVILGSFYVYTSTFLESKEQKILALLFLLSMPSTALELLSYRPSIFILPFLFILLYIALKEPVQWKLLPILWLVIFVIIICHTGTFIFLISLLIVFLLLYCLFWGEFPFSVYITLLSTFVIYVFSLKWFPQIANQYVDKSTIFLSPGNFLQTKFSFSLPAELGNIFYQNMLVNLELIYFIIFGAFIFTLGKLLIYTHQKVLERYSQSKFIFPIAIPSLSISHGVAATPFWIGPIHVLLSFFGFFRINPKGKCLLIATVMISTLPDMLNTAQGLSAATGALREISYLTIIIPITAAIGFSTVISYIDTYLGTINLANKNIISLMVWILVLSAVIITPTVATTYYSPKIAGEDYINDGMKWLGNTGDLNEKVVGYGYRTVPIYTNMTDASYGLMSGNEISSFTKLLKGIYFSSVGSDVDTLRDRFGVKYILISNKLIANLAGENSTLTINDNRKLNKLYSSKDFGVYEVITSSEKLNEKGYIADNISFQQTGSSLQIESEVYKVVLNANNPSIEQFGTPSDNYLGEGVFLDNIQISGLRETYVNPFSLPEEASAGQKLMIDRYVLNNLSASYEITDNQVTYRTILKDQQNGENESSLIVRYTFYPTCFKREFIVSNDWVTSTVARNMDATLATNMFLPFNDFVLKNNQSLIRRHVYPNQDSVVMNEIIPELYIYHGNQGIYLKNEPTTPYPTELNYAGSTLYNYSSLSYSQSASLKPGASLHLTQFLSVGDEITAEKNIQTQEQISLMNYPDGMIPIMLSGYRTPYSDISADGPIEQGYQVLLDENIPYSEVVIPYQITDNSVDFQNRTKVDLREIADKNSKIIGSGSTIEEGSTIGGARFFNNFSTQEQDITTMIDYANSYNAPLIGYMPDSMNYNLDTLKIISDNKIPLMLSYGVSPPYRGLSGLINKNPQMAIYHNSPTDVALLPVSYPMSDVLSNRSNSSTRSDYTESFSAWSASINEAAITNGMVFFIIRSEDIGNPDFTDDFKVLIAYAKNRGLTFTTPDIIADHLKKIQNLQYSGSINNDMATINLTNNNDDTVPQVAFRIVLPVLKTGNYTASGGNIVKTEADIEHVILYVSTDISAHATKEITIFPSTHREKIVVTMPRQPIEGQITITIEDQSGNPLIDAYAIIDSKYYQPDAEGNVNIDLQRGIHTLEIQCPGYEIYSSTLNVKGKIHLIDQFFRNNS